MHNPLHSEAIPKPGLRIGRMGADTTAIKKDERNPMSKITRAGKHCFGKGDRW